MSRHRRAAKQAKVNWGGFSHNRTAAVCSRVSGRGDREDAEKTSVNADSCSTGAGWGIGQVHSSTRLSCDLPLPRRLVDADAGESMGEAYPGDQILAVEQSREHLFVHNAQRSIAREAEGEEKNSSAHEMFLF